MDQAGGDEPQAAAHESVMVLSCWPEGAGDGMLVRATVSGPSHEPRVLHAADRSRVHELVDEWLDAALQDADPPGALPGAVPDAPADA